MTSKSPLFDDFANLMTNAAGAAKSAGEEFQAVVRAQMDRVIADMDLVGRDEFEAIKTAALEAQAEAAALRERVEALEKAGAKPAKKAAAKSTSARK